jgi:ABC-type Na+ efflux pump permease subunit
MNKITLVGKREYLKIVRKPSFWLATLFFPVFLIVVTVISGESGKQTERKIREETAASKLIYISDPASLIAEQFKTEPFVFTDDVEQSIGEVKTGAADAVFIYPTDVLDSRQIQVYAKSKGLLKDTGYNAMATNLLKQSILSEIGDQRKIEAYTAGYQVEAKVYKDGEEVNQSLEHFIVPVVVLAAYFIMMIFAVSYLLMSVSEEKENRMIETILSIVKPRELIWGKILGQVGIILTQFAVLVGFAALGFAALNLKLPVTINLSAINVDPVQVITSIWYLACGFLIMANTMVGVGSIMPSYKDASSFSSVFIMLSIFPIYFFTILLTEPSGLVAYITSYFPFSAAMVLLFRNALGALPLWESILSSVVLFVYVVFTFYLAYKLFELGSLEYRNKISLRQIIGKNKKAT